MATLPDPPRPHNWEEPTLKPQSTFFIQPNALRDHISERLRPALDSNEFSADVRKGVENFLRSSIDFGHHQDWEAHRLLGRGGYGTVGLWVRRNSNNDIVDELAVKDQTPGLNTNKVFSLYSEPAFPPHEAFPAQKGLLKEAVLQKQLNEHLCENILHLRGYSFIPGDDTEKKDDPKDTITINDGDSGNTEFSGAAKAATDTEIYRMYTEFSPYQTLEDLKLRYRSWERYLPEAFLWHVFDSLAAALQVLDKGPDKMFSSTSRTRRGTRRWPKDYNAVHFDIKPSNIFLGYEKLKNESNTVTGGSRILGYPVVKVSDYGLCAITGSGTSRNPRDLFWRGTTNYLPSEQENYGVDWRHPPNGKPRRTTNAMGEPIWIWTIRQEERDDPDPGWHFSSAANVWNVGKVMYDMTTLSHASTLGKIVIRNNTENVYNNNGQHIIDQRNWDTTPFAYACVDNELPEIPYDGELMNLVRECLRPSIRLRITPDNLRKRTRAGLARAEHELDPANSGRAPRPTPAANSRTAQARSTTLAVPRLYCRNNDINDMACGATNFSHGTEDFPNMMKVAWKDADWPDLAPPRAIWAKELDQLAAQASTMTNYTIRDGRIWFGPPLAQPNAPNGPDNPFLLDSSSDDDGDDNGGMVYDIDDFEHVSGPQGPSV